MLEEQQVSVPGGEIRKVTGLDCVEPQRPLHVSGFYLEMGATGELYAEK